MTLDSTLKSYTILTVDDVISNLDILSELLKEYIVIETTNGKEALEIVAQEKPDLILLDIVMPDMDGYEVCQRLKSNPNTKDIPIIFITAKTDEDSIEKAYDMGGTDYITKPFLPKELLSRVKKELHIQSLMNELTLLASTDPMTKLYNRRYFAKASYNLYALAQRQMQELSVIMLDIDKFKLVNDTYGHKVGDDVIIDLAHKIINHTRKSDMSARFGGEEFVMLLVNTSLEDTKKVAEKLRTDVENELLEIENDKSISYTISLGVAQVDVHHTQSIENAINNADKALYEAKESGRNKVCFYKDR